MHNASTDTQFTPAQFSEAKQGLLAHLTLGASVVLAGAPGIGKTALVMEMAQELSLQPVLFEAAAEGELPANALVVIESFHSLPSKTQLALTSALRAPEGMTLPGSLSFLHDVPVVIMETLFFEGRNCSENSLLPEVLAAALPGFTLQYDRKEWMEWASKNHISPLLMAIAAYHPYLFSDPVSSQHIPIRALEEINRFLDPSHDELFLPGADITLKSILPDGNSAGLIKAQLEEFFDIYKKLNIADLAKGPFIGRPLIETCDPREKMLLQYFFLNLVTEENLHTLAANIKPHVEAYAFFLMHASLRGKISPETAADLIKTLPPGSLLSV